MSSRRRAGKRLAAALGLLLLGAAALLVALDSPATATPAAQATQGTTGTRASPSVVLAPEDDPEATMLLPRFALNALLATLMDDDMPPRWTTVGPDHFCGPATRVEVDGQPMVSGAPIPATAFTVRWQLDDCRPFGGEGTDLAGEVELLVFHEDTGLSAIVDASRLRIAGAAASARLARPFAASLSLVRATGSD